MAENKQPTTEELLAEAMATLKSQGEELATLKEQINPTPPAAQQKAETPKQAFAVDGVKYKFTVPSYINAENKTVLAKDALKNKAELERLVTIKSGIITQVK